MKKQLLKKIICVAMAFTFVQGVVIPNIRLVPTVAYADTALTGLKREGGYITGKVSFDNVLPGEHDEISLEHLKSIAREVNPVDSPKLFTFPIDDYHLSEYYNYLTGDVLYYSQDSIYLPDGSNIHEDYFLQVLKVEIGSKENYVKTTYSYFRFRNGAPNAVDTNASVEQKDEEAYAYLINESKVSEAPVVTPPVQETPVVTPPAQEKPSIPAVTQTVTRLGGLTRYQTSTAISNNYVAGQKVNNVILASGIDFPDSLSASSLSGKLSAPIVLVRTNVNNSTDALDFVKNNVNTGGTVYLLGGTGVVPDSIIDNLKASGFTNFKRLGGATRFDTNVAINNELGTAKGTPVIISNSYSFADALSIASVSGINQYPIFITQAGKINDTILASIKNIAPSKIYIVGGTGVVSTDVENVLRGVTSDVTRLGGSTRFDTSMAIANHFNLASDSVVLANGWDFPDALSGVPLAVKHNAQILLVPNNANQVNAQSQFVKSKGFKNIYALGDTAVVSDSVVNTIK